MKLKKRQYRELLDRLLVQITVIEHHCLDHTVAEELAYIRKNIQAALTHPSSADEQLAELMKENEGKRDE